VEEIVTEEIVVEEIETTETAPEESADSEEEKETQTSDTNESINSCEKFSDVSGMLPGLFFALHADNKIIVETKRIITTVCTFFMKVHPPLQFPNYRQNH